MKKYILGLIGIMCVCCITACNKEKNDGKVNSGDNQQTAVVEEKNEKKLYNHLTVDSTRLPFKDYPNEAKRHVEENVKEALALSFGDDIEDIKVTDIIVTFEEKSGEAVLNDDNIDTVIEDGGERINFEVTFDILLSKNADLALYATGGHYDENTRLVSKKKWYWNATI